MKKVLVKKAISAQYPVGAGAPVMVLGGGGGGGGNVRGRTKREIAGGVLGGLVGVAGALTGQHRSLGGLTQSMISGGAQGKQIGEALGRSRLVGVGRTRQAQADLDEEARRDYARMTAEGRFEGRKYDVNDRINPATMRRRVQEIRAEDELAREEAKRQNQRAMAEARAFGSERGKERRRMAEYAERLADGMPINEFGSRVNQFVKVRNQAQQAQQDYDPMANSPIGQGTALPLPPAQNKGSAANEVNDIEQAGEKMMAETGMNDEGEYAGMSPEQIQNLTSRLNNVNPQGEENEGRDGRPVRVIDEAQRNLKEF